MKGMPAWRRISARLGAEVGVDAADGEVHLGEAPGGVVRLLAVDGDIAGSPKLIGLPANTTLRRVALEPVLRQRRQFQPAKLTFEVLS
jgi:hypothetical protein